MPSTRGEGGGGNGRGRGKRAREPSPDPEPSPPVVRALYAGLASARAKSCGILVAHPSCFCILRPWAEASCGGHPTIRHVAVGRSEAGLTAGGGACIPFAGFEYSQREVGALRSILGECSIGGCPREGWGDDVLRMMSFWNFPFKRGGEVFFWDRERGLSIPPPPGVPRVDTPPDYIPLPRRVRAGTAPSPPTSIDRELAYVRSHLRDLSNIASMNAIRTGDTVYLAQGSSEGAFPPGLYAARVVVRISTSRAEVFAPRNFAVKPSASPVAGGAPCSEGGGDGGKSGNGDNGDNGGEGGDDGEISDGEDEESEGEEDSEGEGGEENEEDSEGEDGEGGNGSGDGDGALECRGGSDAKDVLLGAEAQPRA